MNVLDWVKGAEVGERVVYRKRDCMKDHVYEPVIMSAARLAHDQGLVFLAQRKVRRDGVLAYVHYEATRISRPVAQLLGLVERPR